MTDRDWRFADCHSVLFHLSLLGCSEDECERYCAVHRSWHSVHRTRWRHIMILWLLTSQWTADSVCTL